MRGDRWRRARITWYGNVEEVLAIDDGPNVDGRYRIWDGLKREATVCRVQHEGLKCPIPHFCGWILSKPPEGYVPSAADYMKVQDGVEFLED